MALSKRSQANIERQSRRLCGSAGQSEFDQPEGRTPMKPKSRAEANIERQTAKFRGR